MSTTLCVPTLDGSIENCEILDEYFSRQNREIATELSLIVAINYLVNNDVVRVIKSLMSTPSTTYMKRIVEGETEDHYQVRYELTDTSVMDSLSLDNSVEMLCFADSMDLKPLLTALIPWMMKKYDISTSEVVTLLYSQRWKPVAVYAKHPQM